MKKNIIKYLLLTSGLFISVILYLSTVGIETEKFNKQIQDLVKQKNDKLDASLKKIKNILNKKN